MGSSRDTFKQILADSIPVPGAGTFTSPTLNVEGRTKATFLVYCDVNCTLEVEWSWTKSNDEKSWYLLANTTIPVVAGSVKRITLDDALSYIRLRVRSFAGPGNLSAWIIAL